jgi:DNA-binding MarR family transcriptional regulator
MTQHILVLGLDLPARRTLLALYELGALDQPAQPGALARLLGMPPRDVVRSLRVLDARGLVWAERCRLTLHGLSMAARLAALRARRRARQVWHAA